jgi:hypothetical protein
MAGWFPDLFKRENWTNKGEREREKERERLSHWSLALDFVRLCDYHFSPFGQINELTK